MSCKVAAMQRVIIAVVLTLIGVMTMPPPSSDLGSAQPGGATPAPIVPLTSYQFDEQTFFCPDAPGLYPDPNNCARYYECGSSMYGLPCASGKFFNPTTTSCEMEGTFVCTAPVITGPTFCEGRQSGSYADEEVCERQYNCFRGEAVNTVKSCPDSEANCFVADGYFYPDQDNCARFYQCHNGYRYGSPCPTGDYYNAEIRSCRPQGTFECSVPMNATSFCDNGIPDGIYRHDTECGSRYVCLGGVTYTAPVNSRHYSFYP